ncbi:MAG: hypothetical protein ACTSRJ_00145 [Candidatus Hodarchaeales archaeon]
MHHRIINFIPFSILGLRFETLPENFPSVLGFFAGILPFFYVIAIMITNSSLVLGGIIFLLDSRENNGKEMIFRSLIVITIFFFIFKGLTVNSDLYNVEISNIELLGTFILLYLLFSLAALALIMFFVNCGLYMINPNSKNVKGIKKSVVCIFAVLLPLGLHFPTFPIWG